ncbi:MAG: TolB-like protein/tetratricopeptide (TPR) repeat protein [Arenicella sp.]
MTDRSLDKGFSLGRVHVYPLDFKIVSTTGEQQLSPIGMEVLCELAEANGEAVTAEHLITQIWGNTSPDEGTLEHYVAELMHKFDTPSDQDGVVIVDTDGLYRLRLQPVPIDGTSTRAVDNSQRAPQQGNGFLDELRKRKVSQTGVLYLVAAWLILQFADVTFEALGLGDEIIRLILITTIVGFPITLVLSWFYDVKRSDYPEALAPTSQGMGYVLIGALIAIPIAITYQWFYLGDLGTTDSNTQAMAEYDSKPNSIAVLAFENLGSDNSYDYFGHGIAEEILNALSSTGEMLVAPRTSSFVYRNNPIGAKNIGKQLGVRYILDGSVRRIGQKVRVIATLINISSGYQIWSKSYSQEISNIFDVQLDISKKVVQSLNIVLSAEKSQALGTARTTSVEAYDYYLQGRDYLNRPKTQSSLNSAIQLFSNAIKLDSEYSDAYAGLCESYLKHYIHTDTSDWFTKAENACQETLRFDLVTVDVRIALGNLYRQSGQYNRSLLQLGFALEKDPDNIDALSALALTNASSGNGEEAEILFRKAISVQPRFWRTQEDLGNFLFERGRPEEAIEYYEQAIELTPDNAAAYNNLGAALLMSNSFEAAAAAWKKSLEIEINESAYSNGATALFMAGKFDDAAAMYSRATEIAKDKHVLWGNLGDAQRFGSDPSLAIVSYRKAISLAEVALKINPSDKVTVAILSHYYANVGLRDKALAAIERAIADDPEDGYVWYFGTLTWLTLDNKDRAVQSLKTAIALGYPTQMVLTDVGLKGLTSESIYRDQLGL